MPLLWVTVGSFSAGSCHLSSRKPRTGLLLAGPNVALTPGVRIRALTVVLLIAAAVGACNSSPTSPTPGKCAVGLSLKPPAITAAGGTGTVSVTAQSGCAWQAASESDWISGLTPSSGTGNGEVNFQVSANSDGSQRVGTIVLNNVRVVVSQPGSCAVAISPINQDIPAAGGNGTVSVTAVADCGWMASSPVTWITVTSGATGTGNGTVLFTVAANSGPARNAQIAVGDKLFMVNQADVNTPVCQFTILPATASVSAAGGNVPVTIQAGATCSWTTASHADWLTLDGADSGSASGSVMVVVAANSGAARTGTMTIAGQTFTVVQGGS